MNENDLISLLSETGPLTGAQLVERTRTEVLLLWQACMKSKQIRFAASARRFLRLDRNVQGYARLSPSIRREFLTYTFVGLENQSEELNAKAQDLTEQTKQISRTKRDVAKESIISAIAQLPDRETILKKACFILAGDVVYDMSHVVSRPEKSTGEMVRGSDLDIVIVAEDDLDPSIIQSLDKAIHKRKHLLLVNDREEIDYLIKSISRVKQQLKFDLFSSKVACKIMDEGQLLYGSSDVYQTVKILIDEYGVPEQLRQLEKQAAMDRQFAEAQLLDMGPERGLSEYLNLFYTHAEEDEIY
jgi:hypothetical protein